MTNLRPLIRYHKWRLDEKQRALSELRGQEERILAEAAQLEEQIKSEQRTASAHYEVAHIYAAFARAALGRRHDIARRLATIRARIAAAAEDLAECFREVKTYEIAQEERDKRDAEEQRHKENLTLDETAQIGHHRRREDEEG